MTARRLTEVVAELGITYRQADYWSRHGFISTTTIPRRDPSVPLTPRQMKYKPVPVSKGSGSGYVRVIADGEVEVLRLMVQLVALTITPPVAAEIARALVGDPNGEVLVEGLVIRVAERG